MHKRPVYMQKSCTHTQKRIFSALIYKRGLLWDERRKAHLTLLYMKSEMSCLLPPSFSRCLSHGDSGFVTNNSPFVRWAVLIYKRGFGEWTMESTKANYSSRTLNRHDSESERKRGEADSFVHAKLLSVTFVCDFIISLHLSSCVIIFCLSSPLCSPSFPPRIHTPHTPLIHPSYTTHTPLIHHSYTPHTPLIYHSYTTHTPLIHHSYFCIWAQLFCVNKGHNLLSQTKRILFLCFLSVSFVYLYKNAWPRVEARIAMIQRARTREEKRPMYMQKRPMYRQKRYIHIQKKSVLYMQGSLLCIYKTTHDLGLKPESPWPREREQERKRDLCICKRDLCIGKRDIFIYKRREKKSLWYVSSSLLHMNHFFCKWIGLFCTSIAIHMQKRYIHIQEKKKKKEKKGGEKKRSH